MDIVLGPHQYGKAEVRLVHVVRHGERHHLTDLTVGVALAGDLADTHLTGDNSRVLPTDSQKNTVYAFARRHGVGEIEEFGLLLARHFVESQSAISRATVTIEQHAWGRLGEHSFARAGAETRTTTVTVDGSDAVVVSGLTGMVLMNTTASEFFGFVRDEYTTLPDAHDRILATAVDARWRHATSDNDDWAASFAETRRHLVEAFVGTHSLSLQQTLYAMGRQVLAHRPEITEVRLSLPNKHHFTVDLAPFGLDNPNQVFHAPDRPYGLIEGAVRRDDAPQWADSWWDS
ncbi:urate oxidase [Micromonospora sp. WMMD1120]|uniref:factor-independent urate hydroxylase n=1 Tax=Micromonospora sp. WMMD1120 TaxID=3016106 RepID=UPI002415A824|nr:urate oxidase [Micromonospora sp. WMMD1120]MDG4809448.1 urate oxidase [Micromonospora sp. WMMD1120]